MIISNISLYQYRIALNPNLPVASQRIDHRRGLVLSMAVEDSALDLVKSADVEVSPLSGLDIEGNQLVGFSLESLQQVTDYLIEQLPLLSQQPLSALITLANQCVLPSAAFGLSLLYYKLTGDFNTNSASRCITNSKVPLVYIPNLSDDMTEAELIDSVSSQLALHDENINFIKVKVGQFATKLEIALIYGILALRPNIRLRLDANRHFTLDDAINFAACLPKDNIDYIEEPCINPNDNMAFYKALGIHYALDETLNDPHFVFEATEGLLAVVIKPMLCGSLDKLANFIKTAESHGVRSILSSALESSLGISDLSILAGQLTPDYAPGLDTLTSFTQDLLVIRSEKPCLTTVDLPRLLQI